MGKIERIQVPPEDRERLVRLERDRNTPQQIVWRSQIVLLSGEGIGAVEVARRVGARDFFLGVMATDRRDDELIEAVEFPTTGNRPCTFREVARRHGDFAIVACATVKTERGARLAVGGV